MPTSPPETRASLLLRLRDAADVAAWNEVVEVYGPLVFRMAKQQGLQTADADDVVQEVFLAAGESVSRWMEQPNRGRFRGWLLGVARNIAINVLTRRPKGGVGVGGDGPAESLAEISAPTELQSSQFDLEYRREVYRWAAEQVRETVSPTTWDAFHLTHVERVSVDQAARQLGISIGGIYVARSRVMNRLRQLAQQFEVRE